MAQNPNVNPFASKVLIITVGPKKTLFNIHEALLQTKTSFFQVHKTPNGGTSDAQSKEFETEPAFKTESSSSPEAETFNRTTPASTPPPTTEQPTTTDTTPNPNGPQSVTADYHLTTHFVKAFGIFVEWLYHCPPKDPKSPSQCKTLIQTYLLALQYQAQGLQNLIIECVRRFHIENNVNFDLLFIYFLNRKGDDPQCKLMKYFVDQIAYEIADQGIDEFDKANLGFDFFFRDRNEGKVRTALMHAVGKIATAAKSGHKILDPAVTQNHDYFV